MARFDIYPGLEGNGNILYVQGVLLHDEIMVAIDMPTRGF